MTIENYSLKDSMKNTTGKKGVLHEPIIKPDATLETMGQQWVNMVFP
jgi:hypothetical protein